MKYSVMKMIRNLALKICGLFFRPRCDRIYASFLKNSFIDGYDILNCNSSNLLRFLNRFVQCKQDHPLTVYVEYANENRLAGYREIQNRAKENGITLCFVRAAFGLENNRRLLWKTKISNFCVRMTCKYWMTETVESLSRRFHHKYHQFCMNYFISCKNDFQPKTRFSWAHCDSYVTTALLPSQVVSSATGVGLDHCRICGFPRNDTLFHSEKQNDVYQWLEQKMGYRPEHIFLYMPTYRDYETNVDLARPIMGYEFPGLAGLMEKSHSVLIYKLHPWQNISAVEESSGFIKYPQTCEFSMYDIMAVADCFIGDYSSATFDFMLLDKPIIYNLYDLEEYLEKRGVSYDPFESFCGGTIVRNAEEMERAIEDVLAGRDPEKEKRNRICTLMHKYRDGNSTQRVIESFMKVLEE